MKKNLRVNEAARESGVSEAWLRRSKRTGRIPMARRDLNGWRVYTEADVAVLRELLFPTGGCLKSPTTPDAGLIFLGDRQPSTLPLGRVQHGGEGIHLGRFVVFLIKLSLQGHPLGLDGGWEGLL